MFRGSYQKKLLTILYSGGSNPLELWDIQVKNGWTRRVKDDDMGTIVFEIAGTNVATAFIVSPPDPKAALGISLPFITMFIKNLKRYFTFEIQILDDKQMRRRFRFSNYQSSTKVRPFTCSVPLALRPGWNQMQLNLANFTTRAYGTNYMETQRVQIHANCRIRRVYFSDRLYTDEELPRDYRTYTHVRQVPHQPPPQPAAQKPIPSSILKQLSHTDDVLPPPPATTETPVTEASLQSSPSTVEHRSVKSHESAAQLSGSKSLRSIQKSDSTKVFETTSSRMSRSFHDTPAAFEGAEPQEEMFGSKEEEEQLEVGPEPPEGEQLTDAKEDLEEESPRSEVGESEYAASEPPPESDLEEAREPADLLVETDTDEPDGAVVE